MFENRKIGMIGCGKMGTILLKGILDGQLVSEGQITVADAVRDRLEEIRETYPLILQEDNQNLVRQADILILAVKPQNLPDLLNEIALNVHPRQLILSIAAGISTQLIEKHFSEPVRVVRAMPNTPALVGEGVTALAAVGTRCGAAQAGAQRARRGIITNAKVWQMLRCSHAVVEFHQGAFLAIETKIESAAVAWDESDNVVFGVFALLCTHLEFPELTHVPGREFAPPQDHFDDAGQGGIGQGIQVMDTPVDDRGLHFFLLQRVDVCQRRHPRNDR